MITDKLQQARVKLQQKKLKKSGKNQYYNYFELADFIPAVNEIFAELKLHSMFNITQDKAILRIIDTEDKTEELYECPYEKAELRQCTKVQALGATMTYLKRYLYMNALEIVESDYFDAKTNDDMKKAEEDIDIFEGLQATDTPENTLAYYRENKDKVHDKKRFETLYKQRYLKLKKEVRNGENNN
jgi:hypothetical protein|nr:MAG TPA_asm: ERF superfamily protein [Caudoviricetes sp.]